MKSKIFYFLLLSLLCESAFSQEKPTNSTTAPTQQEEVVVLTPEQERVVRLKELAVVIKDETKNLSNLKKQLSKLPEDKELQEQVEQKNRELDIVQKSFDQIATSGISFSDIKQVETPKNWQEELTLVVKPLLENLRGLTEKPRKKESLRQEIATQKSHAQTANLALETINKLLSQDKLDSNLSSQLSIIKNKWQRSLIDAQRKQELAVIELANLNGSNESWFESFKVSLKSFARERGLTLLIALVVASVIVFFFKGFSRFIDYRRSKKKLSSNRTTYRIIAYVQRLLTIVCIIISVMIVFFVRGDVLLMAIMSILFFTSVLGLRHFIPQFLDESRLLLNIGRVREHELVVFNGVPWRVASINVFSKLINPEIKGVLRLPLGELKSLTSRKIGDEKWFPSSIGDWVLDDANKLYEVVDQGPDSVELQSAQGTNKLVPTADYFAAGHVNLTKSKGIRIVSVFGVDYNLQSICLDEVPEKMQKSVQTYLESMDLGTSDISVRVEFQKAGESSLDYLVIVNVNSGAAKHYYRIQRNIQQACVQICNQEGWGIPFPQLTISKAD